MKKLSVLTICLFLFSTNLFSADVREEYDRYVASYRAYQEAVTQKKPVQELKTLLEDYHSAKEAYYNVSKASSLSDLPSSEILSPTSTPLRSSDGSINIKVLQDLIKFQYERTTEAYQIYKNAVSDKKPVDELQLLLERYTETQEEYNKLLSIKPTISTSAPQEKLTDTTALAPTESVDSKKSGQSSKIPAELETILTKLWSPDSRNNPDQAIKALQAFITLNPNSPFVNFARYQLAQAYDYLKGDLATAEQLLAQIINSDPSSELAKLALERINYYRVGAQYQQVKTILNDSCQLAEQKYKSYLDTSWLAFPVKIAKWADYFGKQYSFNKNQNKAQEFRLKYEAMGAKFVPPIDITFDRFVPVGGSTNPTSEIALHYNNPNAWYTRWQLVSLAKKSIDIQYFIMDEDVFGHSLLSLLLAKAEEGIKIRLMLDARGTKTLTRAIFNQNLLQTLARLPNVDVRVFRPVNTSLITALTDLRQLMASNHDKILVVDDELSVVGGRNISRDYFLGYDDHPGAFRDTDLVIKSTELARQLQMAFEEEFYQLNVHEITEKKLSFKTEFATFMAALDTMTTHIRNLKFSVPQNREIDEVYQKEVISYLNTLKSCRSITGFSGFQAFNNSVYAPVKILDNNSIGSPRGDITDELIKYVDGAKHEIVIQNPYVVLTERMFAALQRAGSRGVSVIIHTNSPYSTDSLMTQAMFYADWKNILAMPNTRVFVYQDLNKLHAKNWVFDGLIGAIGTYNLDFLSEEVNSEVVAVVKSAEFAKILRQEIMSDISVSREYLIHTHEDGTTETIFGPDDLPGENFWLLKALSNLTVFKKFI